MALEVIKSFAAKIPFLDLKATFVSAFEALSFLKTTPVDLVFLDINMPDLTGLDVVPMLGLGLDRSRYQGGIHNCLRRARPQRL